MSQETFSRPAWQNTLFAGDNPALVVFINFDRVTETEFKTIVEAAHPRFLFDLRRVPRFNLGTLTRRQAFSLFSASGSKYVDLSGHLTFPTGSAKRLEPETIARVIRESPQYSFARGPVAFIVETQQFDEAYITRLVDAFPSVQDVPWDVLRIPAAKRAAKDKHTARDLVFISHANPEDNDFAFWLTGQLTLAGYSVWSDVTKLVGGEVFWEDIEGAIRHRSSKVVVVLSNASQSKAGVLDEIDLAVRVERSGDADRFVIPIRIDALPFSAVRANIARKNVIDFNGNWASGLHALLRAFERDRVPRSATGGPDQLAHWASVRLSTGNRIAQSPEKLTSNWLPISLPSHVYLHSISASMDQIGPLLGSVRLPHFRYLRLIGAFSSASDLQAELPPEISVSESYRVKMDHFLAGRPQELPGLSRWEAQRLAIAMLRQAWDLEMQKRGLNAFELASGVLAWYLPKGLLEADRVEFLDDEGKRRRRTLVGWSERRQVFWHFAVEARPALGDLPRFILRQHVIFTPDGNSPVESKERMHLLRRRFCKSWWNDRWRDLLIAFVSWLNSSPRPGLNVGESAAIALDRTLMSLVSPISVLSEEALTRSVSDDEPDELSDDELFDDIEVGTDDEGSEVVDA